MQNKIDAFYFRQMFSAANVISNPPPSPDAPRPPALKDHPRVALFTVQDFEKLDPQEANKHFGQGKLVVLRGHNTGKAFNADTLSSIGSLDDPCDVHGEMNTHH